MKTNKVSLLMAILLAANINLAAQGIKINSGAYLVVNGAANLVVNNSGFTNNGQFIPGNGAVIFAGSSSTSSSFINGSSTTGFNSLNLNKTTSGIQLGRSISINNTLLFTSGDSLFLNGFNIDLGTTGLLTGETYNRRITGRTGGYIQSTQTLNAPSSVNPGNLGFRITSSADLGSTVIRRGHQQQSGASIYRYFTVTPTNNSGLDASVDFFYFDNELAGIAEPNLALFSSANGGVQWLNMGEDAIDQGADILTVGGIDVLNRFTLSNISAPLAVKLIRFYGVPAANEVTLYWVTGTEVNNQYFAIERSADGVHFMKIGQVPGIGTTSQEQHYQFADQQPLTGKSWYRLCQVDIDGKNSFTPVLMINRDFSQPQTAKILPNPIQGTTAFLNISSEKAGEQVFLLYNQGGVLLNRFTIKLVAGTQLIEFNTGSLLAGVYFIRRQGKTGFSLSFVKQ